jgi:histidinol-phosphate aminotransferase
MLEVRGLVDPWRGGLPAEKACPPDSIDLSDTSSPFGPSAMAIRRASERLSSGRSPRPECMSRLREALSQKASVPPEQIAVGAGCRALLPALLRGLLAGRPDATVALPRRAAPLHRLAAALAAAPVAPILEVDEDPFAPAAEPWCRLLRERRPAVALMGHPQNPSGAFLERSELQRVLVAAHEVDCVLVVDETFADYAERDDFTRLRALLDEFSQLLLVRSFSAVHGLGLTPTAWSVGHSDLLSRLGPFLLCCEPGELGAEAAMASLSEPGFEQMVADRANRARFHLAQGLKEMKADVFVKVAPWVLLRVRDASRAAHGFAARGVRVRDLSGWGFDGWLRIRTGRDDEADRLLAAARAVLKGM